MTAMAADVQPFLAMAQQPNDADNSTPLPKGRRTKGPKREKTDEDFREGMRRLIRAYMRRAVVNDPTVLADMMKIRREFDEAIDEAARTLHDDKGFSWGVIGYEVGLHRDTARRRWTRQQSTRYRRQP